MEENSTDSELASHLIVLRPNPKKNVVYETLCPLQSRLQHVYHGQPYAIVDYPTFLFQELGPFESYSGGRRWGSTQVVQLPRQGHVCYKNFIFCIFGCGAAKLLTRLPSLW